KTKLNDAIAFGLGHASYADNVNDFVSFVYDGQQNSSGSESVAGTFVIRSGVAGSAGNLTFTSDNQDLINLLGLNTIQYSQDNQFTVSIYDAHNGKTIVENLATEGNSINGVLSQNMSIEFDSMANVKAHWDEATKNYYMASESDVYSAILHIQDRSTSFQIGQNWGEDIYINIGDLRAEALGLNEVDVSTFKNASKSITLIDMALHKVNSQRSKVGAYQNELEYNANSLTNTSLHLQESESRLKDADMAKEYMEFVKLQILNGTGTSMLAQANQNSQNLMKIMGV
ncbi:MAG: flagellin, partial [Synergistaceae bacterium]|nr:flagellin [Synergistaceae bacterium]